MMFWVKQKHLFHDEKPWVLCFVLLLVRAYLLISPHYLLLAVSSSYSLRSSMVFKGTSQQSQLYSAQLLLKSFFFSLNGWAFRLEILTIQLHCYVSTRYCSPFLDSLVMSFLAFAFVFQEEVTATPGMCAHSNSIVHKYSPCWKIVLFEPDKKGSCRLSKHAVLSWLGAEWDTPNRRPKAPART